MKEKNKMSLFKRKKRLKKLDECPDIKKGCAFKDSGILYPCRDGNYATCLIYRSNRESEEEKYKKSEEEGEK